MTAMINNYSVFFFKINRCHLEEKFPYAIKYLNCDKSFVTKIVQTSILGTSLLGGNFGGFVSHLESQFCL